MALLLAEERFLKIKQVVEEEQNQPELGRRFGESKLAFDGQAISTRGYSRILMSKLLEDVRNINEELSEYINCPSWNRPTFYDNDDDETDVFDFEDIEYVSLEEVNDVDQEEEEIDLEDILQIQDIEPDQGGLTSVVISDNSNDPLLELPEFESFHPSFPHPPPEPPNDCPEFLKPLMLAVLSFDYKSFKSSASFGKSTLREDTQYLSMGDFGNGNPRKGQK
ncbi:hypothetical protein Tco_0316945 [Tanacetum coccineum]